MRANVSVNKVSSFPVIWNCKAICQGEVVLEENINFGYGNPKRALEVIGEFSGRHRYEFRKKGIMI